MRRSTRVTSPCWREAGKTLTDATGELREAVDFLRYSFAQAQQTDRPARKRIACIRQWNFPLAISTGQIAGALANGDSNRLSRFARAPILPLITAAIEPADVLLERHVCVDTTASGGNAELLAEVAA